MTPDPVQDVHRTAQTREAQTLQHHRGNIEISMDTHPQKISN